MTCKTDVCVLSYIILQLFYSYVDELIHLLRTNGIKELKKRKIQNLILDEYSFF